MKAARGNVLGAGMPNNKVKYSRLAADDDGYIDLQVRRLSSSLLVTSHTENESISFHFSCTARQLDVKQ